MKDTYPSDREGAQNVPGPFRRRDGRPHSFRIVAERRAAQRRLMGDAAVDFVIARDNASIAAARRPDEPDLTEGADIPQFPDLVNADSPYAMTDGDRLDTPRMTISDARAAHPEFGQRQSQ